MAEYVVGTPAGPVFGDWIEQPEAALHVPTACDVEVTSLLRRLARGEIITDARAEESLVLYLSLPLLLHATRPLLPRVWSLRHNFSAYDACYVALAEALDARLLTADGNLARAATRHSDVVVVGM